MQRVLSSAAVAAAALALADPAMAQNCYDLQHQCFSFAPTPQEAGKIDTGVELRSQKLRFEGDIRLRLRAADYKTTAPNSEQQATRARARLIFQATENATAFVEFNISETWAGSDSYSDALAGQDFNGLSQAYVEVTDMFGFGDKWRVGRSEYVLGNGLILGSCDFLQRPSTFTGAWASRNFGGHDVELFVLDDYGPLQSTNAGTRYAGGTARINLCESGIVQAIKPFALVRTGGGYVKASNDIWYGVDANGGAAEAIEWHAEWARRAVDGGKDRMAWRAGVEKKLDLFEGVVDKVSFTHTDSDGAMHVNPADFNSAGLLHQYAGAWRSDLQTNQLGLSFRPGLDIHLDLNLLTLDRRGTSTQQGDFEADVVVGRMFKSGVHAGVGYGFDNDNRMVGYFQLSLFF